MERLNILLSIRMTTVQFFAIFATTTLRQCPLASSLKRLQKFGLNFGTLLLKVEGIVITFCSVPSIKQSILHKIVQPFVQKRSYLKCKINCILYCFEQIKMLTSKYNSEPKETLVPSTRRRQLRNIIYHCKLGKKIIIISFQ